LLVLLLVAFAGTIVAADDPYASWMQGRPQESLPALRARAEAGGAWSAWYDCGLAAAAAGDRGTATACLLEARRRAPARPEPLAALRELGAPLPPTWCEHLGRLAWLGAGWAGVTLALAAGLVLGWWATRARRSASGAHGGAWPLVGGIAIVAVLPGAIAVWHDAHEPLVAALRDTALLDSTGAATGDVAAGTVAWQAADQPWNGRVLVRLADGRKGWVSAEDVAGSARR
jgi:hypothetical protein